VGSSHNDAASSSSLPLSLDDRRDHPSRPKLLLLFMLLLLLVGLRPCTSLLLGAVSCRNCRSCTKLLTENVGIAPAQQELFSM
jgi:hypothetical protein